MGKVIHGERYLRGMVAVESEDLTDVRVDCNQSIVDCHNKGDVQD